MQLYYLDPVFMHVLAMYHETDVVLYCAWGSFLELGQAHYKFIIIMTRQTVGNCSLIQ